MSKMTARATAALVALIASPASAAFWQDPVTQDCTVAAGGTCEILAKCPSYQHAATIAAFHTEGFEPASAQIGVISMMPVEGNGWRIVWRNSGDAEASFVASVTLRCGKNLKWGE